jgi:hypothetical protein
MQFVSDCLSGAGAVLLLSVATIVACGFFEAGFNAIGRLTQRVFQLAEPQEYWARRPSRQGPTPRT